MTKISKNGKKLGRPSEYTQATADAVCEQLALGYSLRTVCEMKGMPTIRTVFAWMREHEDFLKQYARAKQESTDAMAEQILDISDESIKVIKSGAEKKSSAYAQAQRLRVDTRKWLMAKMKPKKYGDSIDVTSDHKPIPLLHVLHNNSDTKDKSTDEKNQGNAGGNLGV